MARSPPGRKGRCLSRRRYSCAGIGLRVGGSKSGDGQTLSPGVVLGEPGVRLGERGRRDPPAAEARAGRSLFSQQDQEGSATSRYTKLQLMPNSAAASWGPAVRNQTFHDLAPSY